MTARVATKNNWTELDDTPGTITASRPVVGNSGATALEFGGNALTDYLRRDGSNTITGVITPDTNNDTSFGSESVRFRDVFGRVGVFVGGDGVINTNAKNNAAHGGIIAGSQNLTGTAQHNLNSNSASFPAVALMGNTYNAYAGSTCIFENRGGGATQFGSAYTTYDAITSRISTTAFGAFTATYAWAYGGDSLVDNQASGSVLLGYPASSPAGGAVKARNFSTAAGCFTLARTPYNSTATGDRRIYNRGPGAFVLGYVQGSSSGITLVQANNGSKGSFVAGLCSSAGANAAQLRTGNNDVGAFSQGAVYANTELARIEASADGAFAQGQATNAIISVTGTGGFARGNAAASNDITATAAGAHAFGDSTAGVITASAVNAFQIGPGINATVHSLQVGQTAALGTGLKFHAGGAPGVPVNGDMWVTAAGAVTIMSGGVACVCTNAVM